MHKCPRMNVLCAMHKCWMGDGENWTNRKVGKTESMENSCLQFSECWWNITIGHYEKLKNGCHFINIDHTEKFQITKPPKVWVSGFLSVDGHGISPSAIMKKLKNGCHFVNIDCMEKFQITKPPKIWVSGFPIVDGNRISPSAIMKKLKNGCHFVNIDRMEKIQITDPPQNLGLWFSKCQRKRNIPIGHYEKIEKWLPFR